jgi:hypothetical protein
MGSNLAPEGGKNLIAGQAGSSDEVKTGGNGKPLWFEWGQLLLESMFEALRRPQGSGISGTADNSSNGVAISALRLPLIQAACRQ